MNRGVKKRRRPVPNKPVSSVDNNVEPYVNFIRDAGSRVYNTCDPRTNRTGLTPNVVSDRVLTRVSKDTS